MMMIRTAGGPPPVHPFDFNDRKTPLFTRTTWIALGVVAVAHLGLGAALYYQRFELAPAAATPVPPTTIVELFTPPKPIDPPKTPPPPQAPNTVFNETLAPVPPTIEPITVAQGEASAPGPVITLAQPAPEPVADGVGAEPAAPTPSALIRNPSWQRQPSSEQLMRAYPNRALNAGVGGSVGLNCLVQPSGQVTDCNVTRETPSEYGFGRAAQGLSRYFQVNPRTVNGAAEGSRVNINLRFTPPD